MSLLSKLRPSMLTLAGAALLIAIVVTLASFTELDPGQVGVRLNRLSGEEEIIDRPGIVMTFPLIHDLFVLDATPQTLYLEGQTNSEDLSRLERLTVRANDGSNFWFERLTIQYQIIPEMADTVLHERGEGQRFREWLLPTVRSILRDEFGRQSTRDVSNPATYNAATADAENMLNVALNPHGIRVINVDTPEPRFNTEYEETIEARNTANNQLRVIEEEQDRAATERARVLAQLGQTRNQQYQERRAALEGSLAQAQAGRERRVSEARATLTRTEGLAMSELERANARAVELQAQVNAEVAQVEAQIQALQANGIEAVMRQLARRLEGVQIDIQPFQNDGTPTSIRVENMGGTP